MPTYLCHGFRWQRPDIRIFVIVNDLEDAAPDWIVGPTTSSLILSQMTETFDFLPKIDEDDESDIDSIQNLHINGAGTKPAQQHNSNAPAPPKSRVQPADDSVLMHQWTPLKLLEEYDPEETTSHTSPYAYVADYAVRIDLSGDIAEEMARYGEISKQRGGPAWFEQLRDKVQAGENIRWYIVVCGDEERAVPQEACDSDDETTTETEPPYTATTTTSFSQSVPAEWPLPNGPLPDSSDGSRPNGSFDYSLMQPPPVPVDPDKAKRPGLRHKLSKASGLRRLFGKKDVPA